MPAPDKDHVIFGTAGHIDHGKSSLVKALTGRDPDTLPEEKERGMTIELGFVFMDLLDYERQVVFIDVPGHEKFVKTMAAGAANIDAAALVIAADEGVSVQTREHFDILRLLEVPLGLVVLTKSDLVDADRLAAVRAEVVRFVAGSFLEGAPVLAVSSVTGAGLPELKTALMDMGRNVRKRSDAGFFRMPVDRVFTIQGFGTVVAGTVLGGAVAVGDRVEVFPERIPARVRGVQVHGRASERSGIGTRTALNLVDAKKEDLRRGQCVAAPGSLTPTNRLDTELLLLEDAGKELKHRERVRLHVGTDEVIARVVLLDRAAVQPGEKGFVQFVLEAPTVALPGDRFVIRTFSPLMTIGGGRVLDPAPSRHKRFDGDVIKGLSRLEGGIADVVEQLLVKSRFAPRSVAELGLSLGGRNEEAGAAVAALVAAGKAVAVPFEKDERYLHAGAAAELDERLAGLVKAYFEKFPHKLSMPLGDLRSQFLKLSEPAVFRKLLEARVGAGGLDVQGTEVRLPDRGVRLTARESDLSRRIEEAYLKAGYDSPLEEDLRRTLGTETALFDKVLRSLYDQKKLVRLNPKVTYHAETVASMKALVTDYCKRKGSIAIAELRDAIKLSRKYAQAVLEYFDRVGLTRRVEDRHVLHSRAEKS
jgi:selenocysteine-specific elongation factor